MENLIHVNKLNWVIQNATSEEKNKIYEQIHQLNVSVESIWIRSHLKKDNEPTSSRTQMGVESVKSEANTNVGANVGANPKIKLIEIGGGRDSKTNYYDENGYVYTKSHSTGNALYFRCKNKELEGCNARVICSGKNLEICILSRPHAHGPRQSSLDKLKFCKQMELISTNSPFKKSQEIYNDAKKDLRGQIDMCNIPERERFDVFIHRKLKKNIPLLATSIEQFEKLINDPQYSSSYMYDEQKKLFYHGVWRGSTGANVVFLSDTVLQEVLKLPRMKKSVNLLMDGTFKSLPMHIKFRQLYIISVIIEDRCYPLAYILMTRRDTKSYELILNNLKSMLPGVNVETCMSDYEAATRKAIGIVFPTARLAGCYFHYVQAIVKAFKRYGLQKDEKFKNARQQISALALLPNEFVTPGFKIVSKKFKKSFRWKNFSNYWLKQWAPANISVYGLKHRTNNFAESLNKTINLILKAPHPHIWLLIENLRMVEMNRSDELMKVVNGHMVKRIGVKENVAEEKIEKDKKNSRSMQMKKLNEKIRNATALFDESQNIERFLKNVTFDENLESYFKERICMKSGSGDSGIEEDEDFDENIIPNHLNIESNFRKIFPRAVTKRTMAMECNETVKRSKRN